MSEGHRLRGLQVRESRHHGRGVFERLFGECPLIGGERGVDAVDRVANQQPEVGRDLIVARARRVQAPGGRPDQLAKPALDIHMNVLERRLNLNLPASISDRIVSRP